MSPNLSHILNSIILILKFNFIQKCQECGNVQGHHMKVMKYSKWCPECRMSYLRQKDAISYIVVTLSTFAINVIMRSMDNEHFR